VVGGGWGSEFISWPHRGASGCLLVGVAGLLRLGWMKQRASLPCSILGVVSLGDGPWIMARCFAVTLARSIAWTCG